MKAPGRTRGQRRGGSGGTQPPRLSPAPGGRGRPLPAPRCDPGSAVLRPTGAGAAVALPQLPLLFSGYGSQRRRPKLCHRRGAASRGAEGAAAVRQAKARPWVWRGLGRHLVPARREAPGCRRQGPGVAGLPLGLRAAEPAGKRCSCPLRELGVL